MSQPVERSNRTVLTREEGYRFRVRFDEAGMPDLVAEIIIGPWSGMRR